MGKYEKIMKNDSLLVTKAFGMGVDKQNNSYYSFWSSSSGENFYQDLRAGRDKEAYSFVIFEEFDSKRTDNMNQI